MVDTTKTISDLEAYEILDMEGCPIKLPKARSMTQVRLDLQHLKPQLIEFRDKNKKL